MERRRQRPVPPQGVRPHGDLGEPQELAPARGRDVAHLLLELRATLDEIPSSGAAERARALVRELLDREALGPGPAGDEGWRG